MDSTYRAFLTCYAALVASTFTKIELIFEQVDKLDKLLGEVSAAAGVPEPTPKTLMLEVSDEDAATELEVARALQLPLTSFDPSKLRQRWVALQNRPLLAAVFKAAMQALALKNPALAETINAILNSIPQRQ